MPQKYENTDISTIEKILKFAPFIEYRQGNIRFTSDTNYIKKQKMSTKNIFVANFLLGTAGGIQYHQLKKASKDPRLTDARDGQFKRNILLQDEKRRSG